MKQILQSLKHGTTKVAEVPAPGPRAGQVLIETQVSLVSAGTERMLVEFGKAGWVQKARSQPDKVRQVVDKARTDGIQATLEAVRARLDQPLAMGYCNVGVVVAAPDGGLAQGARVVSNGRHAEVVSAPKNLCAKIPDAVSDDAASFTVLGAIGLQGIRLLQPTLGECVVVTGLGLIGLLSVQMLKAQGCRILGLDPDTSRRKLAERMGAEMTADPRDDLALLELAAGFSRGRGVDAVLITASSASNEPVSQAARMCRKRGRIVLVGVVGLELSRADFYAKELSFQVSCSYGPGRYDPDYEERGQDYPVGFVRWTEQRNFEAVLDLMAAGALDVTPLITHRFGIEEADKAMALLSSDAPSMGILLDYPKPEARARLLRTVTLMSAPARTDGKVRLAVLGAGNYASRVLVPAFREAGADLRVLVSETGVSAQDLGRKMGFARATTDTDAAIADPEADAVVIATRHDAHARQILAALRAGKHVFCEKPLCLTEAELDEIKAAAEAAPDRILAVGFNRPFAFLIQQMQTRLATLSAPRVMSMRVNAGAIRSEHWVHDPATGGGRLIGEACHFLQLLRHLAGAPVASWSAHAQRAPGQTHPVDVAVMSMTFENGSIGTLEYLANGPASLPKERLEIFCGGRALVLDNFRSLSLPGWRAARTIRARGQDKGQKACAAAFLSAVQGKGVETFERGALFEVSALSIAMARAAEEAAR